ncbi:type IV secretory pathway TrbL component [Hansschlegelia beijingensis]|uniref:Type IV secretory pathway TrbL component n=1 Tax=Hansschlegelia beijingensis TaxID=1133344 RepID=A0A7W6D0F6_9HYPH|nr:type IV secretory pathway TrbL component [Hansschlegelia beijingensis]
MLKILIALLVIGVVAAIIYYGYVQPQAIEGKLL